MRGIYEIKLVKVPTRYLGLKSLIIHEMQPMHNTKYIKDTRESRTTQPPASTSHGRFGFSFAQSKLLTSILQTLTSKNPKLTK